MAAAGLAVAAPGLACEVALLEDPGTLVMDHDPFATLASTAPLRLRLENRGAARTLELIFDTGQATQLVLKGPRGLLPFVLRENEGVLPTTGGEGAHFLLAMEADATVRGSLDLIVAGSAVVPPGLHSGQLTMQLRDRGGGQPCREPFAIPVQVLVPSRAQMNIAGASGPIGDGPGLNSIDFGSLMEGAVRTVFLQLRANGDAMIALQSREGGVMRHRDLPEHAAPYAMMLDGRPVELSGRQEFPAPPAASIDGISLPMTFTIGRVAGLPAGRYEDVITISVSAL